MTGRIHTLDDARVAALKLIAVCDDVVCRHRWDVDLNHVIYHVGAAHSLLPLRGIRHYSERMRCPACSHVGAFVWTAEAPRRDPLLESLNHKVEVWSGESHDLVARAGHIEIAWASFHGAVRAYPKKRILLRDGAFVLEDSRLKVIRGGKA